MEVYLYMCVQPAVGLGPQVRVVGKRQKRALVWMTGTGHAQTSRRNQVSIPGVKLLLSSNREL